MQIVYVLKILSLNSLQFCQGNSDMQPQIVTNNVPSYSIFHHVFCMKAKIHSAKKKQTAKVNGLISVMGDALEIVEMSTLSTSLDLTNGLIYARN